MADENGWLQHQTLAHQLAGACERVDGATVTPGPGQSPDEAREKFDWNKPLIAAPVEILRLMLADIEIMELDIAVERLEWVINQLTPRKPSVFDYASPELPPGVVRVQRWMHLSPEVAAIDVSEAERDLNKFAEAFQKLAIRPLLLDADAQRLHLADLGNIKRAVLGMIRNHYAQGKFTVVSPEAQRWGQLTEDQVRTACYELASEGLLTVEYTIRTPENRIIATFEQVPADLIVVLEQARDRQNDLEDITVEDLAVVPRFIYTGDKA